jgi:IS30 family transposase
VYTDRKDTAHINRLIADILLDVPTLSITLDNDVCFQKHEELSEIIAATVFFCHPYRSSEKGTVENRNGRIREFIPRGSDLSEIPAATIKAAETFLRTRYLKCLGYRTPAEAWEEELTKARARATIQKTPHGVRERV